jgi:hypothetical protein
VKFEGMLPSVSEKVYWVVLAAAGIGFLFGTYSIDRDGRLLDQKIKGRQAELARVVNLKDTYLARKSREARATTQQTVQKQPLTLTLAEELVTKNCVNGRLVSLRPTLFKEDKTSTPAVDVKVSGLPFSEVIALVKAVEVTGLTLKKLQLTIPQSGQTVFDMFTVIAER